MALYSGGSHDAERGRAMRCGVGTPVSISLDGASELVGPTERCAAKPHSHAIAARTALEPIAIGTGKFDPQRCDQRERTS